MERANRDRIIQGPEPSEATNLPVVEPVPVYLVVRTEEILTAFVRNSSQANATKVLCAQSSEFCQRPDCSKKTGSNRYGEPVVRTPPEPSFSSM